MAKIGDLLKIVDRVIPESLARDWDNSGFQVGSPDWEAKGIIISLDADISLFDRAKELDANFVITHHPLIFNPIKRVELGTPVGMVLERALRDRVAVYSAHTNLDIMEGGVNDILAEKVGLLDIRPFAEMGRIGKLAPEQTLEAIAARLKADFRISHVAVVGDLHQTIRNVAVCGGSGGSLVSVASENGADLLITGDVKYHAAKDAEAYGICVMDIGHFASESIILPVMASLIKEALEKEEISMNIDIHWGHDPLKIH